MILQGLSAETLARLVTLSRHGEDFSGLLSGPRPPAEPRTEADPDHDQHTPAFRLAAE